MILVTRSIGNVFEMLRFILGRLTWMFRLFEFLAGIVLLLYLQYSNCAFHSFPAHPNRRLRMNTIHPKSTLGRRRPSPDSFSLHDHRCLNVLEHLAVSSGVPQTSVHVEVDGEIHKGTPFGQQPRHLSVALQSQDRPQSKLSGISRASPETDVH